MAISKQEEKALFRFNIIFPMLDANLPRGERSRMVQQICEKEYRIPHSKKTGIGEATVWKWYGTHRRCFRHTFTQVTRSGGIFQQ